MKASSGIRVAHFCKFLSFVINRERHRILAKHLPAIQFLGKSAISPIAVRLSFSLYVCYFRANRSCLHENQTKGKIDFTDFDICMKGDHCEICTPSPWPTFLRSNISNVIISETTRPGEKRHRAIFIDIDIYYQMTPLKKLYFITLIYFLKINN